LVLRHLKILTTVEYKDDESGKEKRIYFFHDSIFVYLITQVLNSDKCPRQVCFGRLGENQSQKILAHL
jgi:hypothetical protein